MSVPSLSSDAQRATAERERVIEANAQSMAKLKAFYGITLPYATADSWRPTKRVSGNIPGFARQFTILCTDGVVAWFEDVFGNLFYGHTQHFTGKIEPLHSAAPKASGTAKPGQAKGKGEGKARKASVPKVSLALALAELQRLSTERMPR